MLTLQHYVMTIREGIGIEEERLELRKICGRTLSFISPRIQTEGEP